jgi:hypothetical protein
MSDQVVIWTDFGEATTKLHVRRMQSGPPVALCGYAPPDWLHVDPVVDPPESECCRKCLTISKMRKRVWPRATREAADQVRKELEGR